MVKFFAQMIFFISLSISCGDILIAQDNDQGNVGNWYEKLYWWKKAKPKYQELVASVKRIKKLKKEFDAKHSVIMSTIQDLVNSLQIDPRTLASRVNNYLTDMDIKIEESYNKDSHDQNETEQLLENKKNLERLKQDFKLLDDLGAKVDEAIHEVLAGQIQRAEHYEEQALNKLELLENVLDDKKAKSFYEEIQNKAENIVSVEDYIQGPLKGYLNQSSIRLNQLTHEIKNLVNELENQHLYLSDKPQIEEPNEPEPEEITVAKKPVNKEVPASIFDKIGSFVYSIFAGIWKIITYPFSWFF